MLEHRASAVRWSHMGVDQAILPRRIRRPMMANGCRQMGYGIPLLRGKAF